MRKLMIFMTIMSLLAFSCQKPETVDYASLKIDAQVIEPMTKAVTEGDMTVFIDGEDFHAQYSYSLLPDYIDVPVDKDIPYVVSAENVTIEESLTKPDIWGQRRYAGSVQVLVDRFMQKDEDDKNVPLYYPVTVRCMVANSILSVVFDPSVLTYYTDPKVVAYTDAGRKLEFTPDNAASSLAHFTAEKMMYFDFSGLFKVSGEQKSHMDCIELEPATHYTLTFKMQNTEGSLGQPSITVIETCEDIYETMTVDPSDDGKFEKQQ